MEGYHARPICERAQHLFQEGLYVIEEKEDEERELQFDSDGEERKQG